MKKWYWRTRYHALALASGTLFFLDGCFLSDQQLAQVWQSVITTGLTTLMSNLLQTLLGQQVV
jgi:hypothetical protein